MREVLCHECSWGTRCLCLCPTCQCTVRAAHSCSAGLVGSPQLTSDTRAHNEVTSKLVMLGGCCTGSAAREPEAAERNTEQQQQQHQCSHSQTGNRATWPTAHTSHCMWSSHRKPSTCVRCYAEDLIMLQGCRQLAWLSRTIQLRWSPQQSELACLLHVSPATAVDAPPSNGIKRHKLHTTGLHLPGPAATMAPMCVSAAATASETPDGKYTTTCGLRQRLLLTAAAATALRSATCCAKPLDAFEPTKCTLSMPNSSCTRRHACRTEQHTHPLKIPPQTSRCVVM